MGRSFAISAPAKLNLALSVGRIAGDRPGALHPICSWMVAIDLCDELTLTRLEDDRFSRYAILWHRDAIRRSEIDWPVTKDLAVRAHLAIERHVGRALPVQLKLEKRIPVGGGLGGGSSDAAAMIRGMNELYELGLSLETMLRLAAGLGSDVSYFIRGGSAIVEGEGERVELLSRAPELHAVVIAPPLACATGEVYAAFDDLGAGNLRAEAVRRLAASSRIASQDPFNDLTEAALRVEPRLRDHMAAIASLADLPVHLAGSGSSLYSICSDRAEASSLAARIEQALGLPAVAVQTAPGASTTP
jgi:4-diphosphocytidyl-2-C-methyl-D-erythritol kinase